MDTRRRGFLVVFMLSVVCLFLFTVSWYFVASEIPLPFQGMAMISIVLLIAFVAARRFRGGRSAFEHYDQKTPPGLSNGMSAILLVSFVVTVFFGPLLYFWLLGYR